MAIWDPQFPLFLLVVILWIPPWPLLFFLCGISGACWFLYCLLSWASVRICIVPPNGQTGSLWWPLQLLLKLHSSWLPTRVLLWIRVAWPWWTCCPALGCSPLDDVLNVLICLVVWSATSAFLAYSLRNSSSCPLLCCCCSCQWLSCAFSTQQFVMWKSKTWDSALQAAFMVLGRLLPCCLSLFCSSLLLFEGMLMGCLFLALLLSSLPLALFCRGWLSFDQLLRSSWSVDLSLPLLKGWLLLLEHWLL